nr:hypothetical protein [Tanacetum cinerariifolium]
MFGCPEEEDGEIRGNIEDELMHNNSSDVTDEIELDDNDDEIGDGNTANDRMEDVNAGAELAGNSGAKKELNVSIHDCDMDTDTTNVIEDIMAFRLDG